ncbi:NAD(P)-binding domain-containing protein [Marinobacterium sp. YM272]|uniref:NAD(P)-binding domain-containing protein n=1 Tax=Marinobacterium sp. YM272 TaxID=3421654 RepID=UPI003D7F6CD0
MSRSIGILGAGHLASYVVAGLRNAGDKRPILVSPRGITTAERLRRDHDCIIAPDNQSLVDQCDLLLIAVKPAQLEDLLSNLSFTAHHLLISCAAGVPLSTLKSLAGSAEVVRTLPLAPAEFAAGVVPLYPDHDSANALLSQLGELIVFDSEDKFELAATAACMNGWIYDFLDQLTDWFTGQGLDADQARALVTHSVSGATALASARPELPLREICDSIATEGTFTKAGLDMLRQQNAMQPWIDACAAIQNALKSGS